MSASAPLRIGILGAARIAPMALIRPARSVPEVRIAAVAARDATRARAFADKHGVPKVHAGYDALIADPELDAIYNPLPNALHCEWTLRALRAGKHVLCEKPIASNAAEAERMAQAAEASGRVLVEAFHWRCHPLAARMREIVRSGVLGEVRRVEASMCIPLPLPGDIRYRFDLGGGATMDTGCYAINLVRFLAEAEPSVESAEVRRSSPDVDRWMRAELQLRGRTQRPRRMLALLGEAARGERARDREPRQTRRVQPRGAASLPPPARARRRGAPQRERAGRSHLHPPAARLRGARARRLRRCPRMRATRSTTCA